MGGQLRSKGSHPGKEIRRARREEGEAATEAEAEPKQERDLTHRLWVGLDVAREGTSCHAKVVIHAPRPMPHVPRLHWLCHFAFVLRYFKCSPRQGVLQQK